MYLGGVKDHLGVASCVLFVSPSFEPCFDSSSVWRLDALGGGESDLRTHFTLVYGNLSTMVVFPTTVAWLGAVIVSAVALRQRQTKVAQQTTWERPALVRDALERNETLYYFGLGSNMLRSKLENRGANGTRIEILDMQPAVVPAHRLAFNLRGFLPLEPGMGSLEPVHEDDSSSSKPLHTYEKPECHGALVHLTAENYERVMQSEGIGPNNANPGYEEVVVAAHPYSAEKRAVAAIALRARPHVRLPRDPCPSARYMSILREGAAELRLRDSYQNFLRQHPVQHTPRWLKRVAIYNLVFTLTMSFRLKWRGISQLQNWGLWKVYVPSSTSSNVLLLHASHGATAVLLLPGALLGALYKGVLKATGKELPPMIQRFTSLMGEGAANGKNETTAKELD